MKPSLSEVLAMVGSAVAAAVLVIALAYVLTRLAARRWTAASSLERSARTPFRLLVVMVAVSVVVGSLQTRAPTQGWWGSTELACRILTIIAAAWTIGAILLFLEDLGLQRYRVDVRDNRAARHARTQVLVFRRLTIALVVVVAFGAVLLSFPGVQAVGASVLASAGLISVVAALAAQSTLGNLIAGVQLAFNDAIRLDDVVVVETEWGMIEEITLSYIVVRLWDDRRMVLPSTYFTTTPFTNWTRHSSELLGAVELDLDWRVDAEAMRNELERIIHETDLWDGRSQSLQVTDAIGGWVHVRVLVSAGDASDLFALRCFVRERLVTWIQRENPDGLPRQRWERVETGAEASVPVSSTQEGAEGSPTLD
jgi:small-conductance mechanosensitive channel